MPQTGLVCEGVLSHGSLNLSGLGQWGLVKPQHSLFRGVSDQDNPVVKNETMSLYCLALWLYPDPCDASRRYQSSGLHSCAGFGWGRVNFFHSSLYGAMFWICAGNSADNRGTFSLLLSSAYTESRPFLLVMLPRQ